MKPGSLRSNDDWRARVHPEDLARIDAQWGERIEKHQSFEVEFRFLLDSGETRWLLTKGHAQYNAGGEPVSLSGVNFDITERTQLHDQVRQLAFHDTLTQLPNRRLLMDRLSLTMAASKRSGNYAALMMLDLDNFKPLNDAHGHHAGDLLLVEVAKRLTECVRETDTVARVGGDEFVVMLGELDADKVESARQAAEVAEKIRVSLALPYQLTLNEEGQAGMEVQHRCTASIGVALFLNHETSQADVMRWADSAMYRAKEAGRNAIRFYGLTQ
jgi:diguanylate cyclase (GGDEF)-like protein